MYDGVFQNHKARKVNPVQNQRQHNTAQVSAAVQPETDGIANSETCSGM
jgi:hypothetical protein